MALSQSQYRLGSVDGTEATHGWVEGLNREANRQAGAAGQFLLRVNVQETAGVAENNVALQFEYRHTPMSTGAAGAWTPVTTTSSVARTGTNTVFSNNQDCTQRLSGTGTFRANNNGCTADGTCGGAALDLAASGCAEALIGLQILGGDTAVGDLIEFRLARTGGAPLDAYDATPMIRVATEILAVQSRDAQDHYSQSASVKRISRTLVAVQATGMSQADLEDAALSFTMNVLGTTVAGSTDPADYTVVIEGPSLWVGGHLGKNGIYNPPGFTFVKDVPQDVKRLLCTFAPSRVCTFGAQAALIDLE